MLRMLLFQFVPTGLALLSFWALSTRIGVWPAFGGWVAAWACLCVSGALLLQSTAIGEMSWKNSVGGFLLRWGYAFTQGKLWRMVVASWLVWSAIGLSVALAMHRGTARLPETAPPGNDGPWPALLFLGWMINGAALLYLFSVLFRHFQPTSSGGGQLCGLIVFLLGLVVASLWLKFTGHVRIAALVAGGPIAILASGYGLMLAGMVIFGRHGNWR